MMSLSNWVYLGVGLGLGLGGWLFGWLGKRAGGAGGAVGLCPSRRVGAGGEKDTSLPSYHPSSQEDNQDVSVLEQLQQTRLTYQMAQQMSQFKAGFLARVSHELRSPLNSLIGMHQLILADLCDDPAEEREFVAQANESALKLVKLLDEILNVARIEHGTNQLEIQPLQLVLVLEEVYNLTRMLAVDRNFSLQLSRPDPEIYILAEPRWLRQVLVNLVDICIAQMQEGSIFLSAQPILEEVAHIWLDVPVPGSAWTEPVDLMHQPQLKVNAAPSPGLLLLLNQTLLEHIKGRLEILPVPPNTDTSHFTRMQITIPLVVSETASLEQAEN